MTSLPKALIVGYVWPEPNSSAAGRHMLSIVQTLLNNGWQVEYASPAQQGEHRFSLASLGVKEHAIALNCSSFDAFVTDMQPDLVVFDRFMMEEQFGWRVATCCPNALRILDTEDLHCLRHARHTAVKQNREMTNADLFSDMAKREIASIYRCDLTLIISDAEIRLLTSTFNVPSNLLFHCPFMLDIDAFEHKEVRKFDEREHFISIGNFRHAPNWDAVLYLANTLWPRIRQQLPTAELHIYGAYPPPKATQLHNPKKGFLIKGWAEDAYEVLANARICLAPLRFGAGIKGKLTDAMLTGTPSVTSSIGAEGMIDDIQAWPGSVTDDAETFANSAVSLYTQADSWAEKQRLATPLLRSRFDKDLIASQLIDRITQLQQTLNTHRLTNFTGAMLQHHQHKSTQYMSQWIEAKNKLIGNE
ncbi:glycosyltransferase family 4 protein [Aestuariibacter sp. AA17]|uniref:Glycosyltransferase family 4 protein n=1 Tax=Fluctibacter corallii TaxID=2984329 RepID=A0ABT3A951_9ALTE|nr:glycosyltransferase family 4 protein [Aestuariibacter sp. AA17]MCV2885209.1 glycosyltransferase family 4 protein [Aestuariibacter sp. AA17]